MPEPIKKSKASVTLIVSMIIGSAAAFTFPFEGLEHRPYNDLGGVKTVCRGHTGKDIQDRFYSLEECDIIGKKDLEPSIAHVVETVDPILDEKMYIAFGDFVFNGGAGNWNSSSMKRLANQGKFREACEAILLYKYVKKIDCFDDKNKKKCGGIKTRRYAERDLCLKGAEDALNKNQTHNSWLSRIRAFFK